MKNLIIRIWSKLKGWGIALYNLPLQKKIGYLFLVPPLIGVYQYLNYAELLNIRYDRWNDIWVGYVKHAFSQPRDFYKLEGIAGLNSNIPIFLGLMAIAGAYLIKDSKQ